VLQGSCGAFAFFYCFFSAAYSNNPNGKHVQTLKNGRQRQASVEKGRLTMEAQTVKAIVPKEKIIFIAVLYGMACAIILLGLVFGVYCALNQVMLPVLTTQIPGFVFGMVIAFLGIRYLFSIQKLKAEVFKTTSRFSWSNFQKEKPASAKKQAR
jgi:hypothetical protein